MENEKNLGPVYLSLPSRDHYNKVRKLLCKEEKIDQNKIHQREIAVNFWL